MGIAQAFLQATLDKAWAKMVEGAVADHVLWLDRHKSAGDAIMHQVKMRLKRQSNATPSAATAQTADATDAALRAHVQAQYFAVTARLDKAEATLHGAVSALDVGFREHTQDAVGEMQRAVTALAERTTLARDSPRTL